jgi:hypothetical protein
MSCVPLNKTFYTLKKLTITFSGILLLGLLFEWWILYFSKLNIDRHFPYTPIDIGGLLLIVLLLTTLIVFIKKVIKQNSSLNFFQLTLAGTSVCFVSEFVFQFIKLLTENGEPLKDRLVEFCIGVIGITFFCSVLSFLVSYQIKTRKTGMLLLFIILFMVFIVFLRTLMPPTLD